MNFFYVLCYLQSFKRFSHLLYNESFSTLKIKLYFLCDQKNHKKMVALKRIFKILYTHTHTYTHISCILYRCFYSHIKCILKHYESKEASHYSVHFGLDSSIKYNHEDGQRIICDL